jgi:hypothetical protein
MQRKYNEQPAAVKNGMRSHQFLPVKILNSKKTSCYLDSATRVNRKISLSNSTILIN